MDFNFTVSHEERWRAEDNEQKALENARRLWKRFVLQTRRDVEERSEQVRNLSTLSALVAGFAVASFLEFNFDVTIVPDGLLIAYGITTALVAAMNMLSMASCQLLSASLLKMPEIYVSTAEEARFILQCRHFALRYGEGRAPPHPRRDFNKLWAARCKGEWQRAFWLFTTGIPLFLLNMALAAWIKFEFYPPAAIVMAVVIFLALVVLLAMECHWLRNVHSKTKKTQKLELGGEVERLGLPFDWWSVPRAWPPGLQFTEASIQVDARFGKECLESDEDELSWRSQDVNQRLLENARYMWLQYVERTSTSVEEHCRQLRGLTFAAGVVNSFAMSALLQLTFDVERYERWILNAFSCTLGLTVALMTVCVAMLMFMNFSIVKTRAGLVCEAHEAHFIARCHAFATTYVVGNRPPAPLNSFRRHWEGQCESEWRRCLIMFMLGVAVFQVTLIFAAWIKFPAPYHNSAIAMTCVLGVGLVWLLAIYLRWGPHAISRMKTEMLMMERAPRAAGMPWDWHLPPRLYRGNWQCASEPNSPRTSPEARPATPPSDQKGVGQAGEEGGCESQPVSPTKMMELLQEWRAEDMLQTDLDNALFLWDQFVMRTVHELNKRQDQLNTLAELASIFLGFMMISFLQFTFDTKSTPPHLQILFAITAALTVSLNAWTMTSCGLMLESLLAAASNFTNCEEQAHFISTCYDFARSEGGTGPPRPSRSFSKHWDMHFEADYRRAFISFGLGVPSFVLNAIFSAWIVWQSYVTPPVSVTVIFGVGMVYLLLFNARFTRHLVSRSHRVIEDAPPSVGLPFDWHLPASSSKTPSLTEVVQS
eukprot:jgi/Botrbrau1/21776/Bobra.0190s0004.1